MSPSFIDAIDYSTFSHRITIDYSLIYTPVLLNSSSDDFPGFQFSCHKLPQATKIRLFRAPSESVYYDLTLTLIPFMNLTSPRKFLSILKIMAA